MSCMKNLLTYINQKSIHVFNDLASELEKYELYISQDATLFLSGKNDLDIIKFDLFEQEIKKIRNSNEFIAFAFGKYVDSIFHQSKFKTKLIKIYEQLSQIALSLNYPKEAIHYSRIILNIDNEQSIHYTKALESVAKGYRNSGDYSKAVEFYNKAKNIYEYRKDKIRKNWTLFHLGKMYLNYLHQPSRAGVFLLQAKDGFESIETSSPYKYRGISSCLDELGDLYRQSTENVDQAIIQYNKALVLNEKYQYKKGIARNLAHLGLSCELNKNTEKAIYYLETSIEILRELKRQEKGLGIRLVQLGNLYIGIGFYEKADSLIDEGMQICKSHRIFQYLAKSLIYKSMIIRKKGKILKSIELLNEALTISLAKNIHYISTFAFELLGDIYTMIEDFSTAKDMIIKSNYHNIESWKEVYNSSPALEETEINSKEAAQMYKSLFGKLFKDYTDTNHKTTKTISNFFELLINQEKEKVNNLGNLFKFGALMSGIRHEVSNLLNNINSELSKLIRVNTNMTDESIKSIKYIKSKCFSGIELLYNQSIVPVTDVNDFVSVKTISTKYVLPIKLNQIIEGFSHYKIRFLPNESFGDYQIFCDLVSFQLILQSIILNSCESFDRVQNVGNVIKISNNFLSGFYHIVIEDNGKGIDSEIFSQIFNIGFTTKANSSGLGLASVKYLLESINGQIEISSGSSGTKVVLIFKIINNE